MKSCRRGKTRFSSGERAVWEWLSEFANMAEGGEWVRAQHFLRKAWGPLEETHSHRFRTPLGAHVPGMALRDTLILKPLLANNDPFPSRTTAASPPNCPSPQEPHIAAVPPCLPHTCQPSWRTLSSLWSLTLQLPALSPTPLPGTLSSPSCSSELAYLPLPHHLSPRGRRGPHAVPRHVRTKGRDLWWSGG